ncbi:MAG TPA: terminase large subunit [Solirubrobacteraceae bacterium]|jgi:phage terminase large subunit-like protein
MTDAAMTLMNGLVLNDGHRWGAVATPDQRADAQAILTGSVPYHFLTRAKGYSKTADVAGVLVVAMLTQLPAGSRLYAFAADKDQGRLLVDSIRDYNAATPELGNTLTIDAFKVTSPSGSVLEVQAADAPSVHGLRPAFVVVDELTHWREGPETAALWNGITAGLGKVAGSRLAVICNAGSPEHFAYDELQKASADPLWRVHEIPGHAPWMPADRLEEQRRRLPDSVFRRLFMNEWVSAEDLLTTLDDLQACVTLDGPQQPSRGVSYTIGVDLGLKHDRTVAAVCHAAQHTIHLDRMEVWQGKKLRPVSLSAVEEWIFNAAHEYAYARVVCDPWQASGMVQRLRHRGVRIEEFTFSSQSVGHLAMTLHNAIREHRLALPNDPDLINELANVKLRETSPGVLRMDHAAGKHDDRAIALALAAQTLVSKGSGQAAAFLQVWQNELAGKRPKQAPSGPPIARGGPRDHLY